jgi:hypothetical protein
MRAATLSARPASRLVGPTRRPTPLVPGAAVPAPSRPAAAAPAAAAARIDRCALAME